MAIWKMKILGPIIENFQRFLYNILKKLQNGLGDFACLLYAEHVKYTETYINSRDTVVGTYLTKYDHFSMCCLIDAMLQMYSQKIGFENASFQKVLN